MAAEGLVAPGGAGLPPNETEQPMAGRKTWQLSGHGLRVGQC